MAPKKKATAKRPRKQPSVREPSPAAPKRYVGQRGPDKQPRKRQKGRPEELTPEIQAEIIKWLEQGNYLETACNIARIAMPTVRNWLVRGRREPGSIYDDFLSAVKESQSNADARDLLYIQKAAREGKWQAAAWRLERKNPQRWGHWQREPDDNEQRTVAASLKFDNLLDELDGNQLDTDTANDDDEPSDD